MTPAQPALFEIASAARPRRAVRSFVLGPSGEGKVALHLECGHWLSRPKSYAHPGGGFPPRIRIPKHALCDECRKEGRS